jgi:Tol biopolymer transport system component
MNVSPALSPDGKRVVFLSERSLFAIDMYVADVATGKVTRTS